MALADERTLDALDFASVRDRVASAARTVRGKARAAALEPHTEFALVRLEQGRTALVRELVAGSDLHVIAAIDPSDLVQTAAVGSMLGPTDLRAIGDALAAAAAAANALREVKHEALAALTAPYTNLRELVRSLTDAIDERGTVLDRASPALGRIRRSLSQAQSDARDRVGSILRSDRYARAIQDDVVTIREGRFVIPVKAEFSGEFPGIVHDTSSSGQTLFIEPLAALDSNNRVRTLRVEEEHEVRRILEEFSRAVGAQADAIERNIEMLAQVDLLVAKANVARAMDAIEPELVDEALVHVEAGRHPLLDDRAVPQSIPLDDGAPDARDQRSEHGRQDRRAQDGRTLRRDGLLRDARSRRNRHQDRVLHARVRRYRRRTVDRGQHIDVLRASRAHARDARTRRRSHRWCSSTRSAAARSPARAPRLRSRCSNGCWRLAPAASSRRTRPSSNSLRAAHRVW